MAAEEAAQALRYSMQRILLQTIEGERCISLLKENRRLYRVFRHMPGAFEPLLNFLEEDFGYLERELDCLVAELDAVAPANAEGLRQKAAAL